MRSSRANFILAIAAGSTLLTSRAACADPAPMFVRLAPGIGYVPGDIEGLLTCNTGVVDTGGSLTLIDAALPDGAAAAYRAIRTVSDAPVARVVNTHYHLDHLYGNAYWAAMGATPVAFTGVRAELEQR